MKKTALLTIHHTTNFGSALQTYALYETVKRMGYDIDLLDYRCEAIEQREFAKVNFKDLKSLYRKIMYGGSFKKKAKEFESFVNSYANLSRIYTKENVKEANDVYDTFLVGSDIVWGLNVTGNDLNYFLKFADDDKKKLAFASSAGFKWDKEYESEIRELLERFDNVGVRESIVADWIEDITGKRPDEVVDPTMLWTKDEWQSIADKSTLKCKDYILVYFCDKDEKILEDAKRLGKKKNLPVYYINYGKKIAGVKSIQPMKIEDFLYLVSNAEYVMSASFHGLLFSLYFNKEVFFYNRANFSRMESLSRWLGIESHNGMINVVEDAEKIDYATVSEKIDLKRRESLNRLENYLK